MNSIKITENLGQEHTSVEEMTKNLMLLYPLGRLDSENSLSSRFSSGTAYNTKDTPVKIVAYISLALFNI